MAIPVNFQLVNDFTFVSDPPFSPVFQYKFLVAPSLEIFQIDNFFAVG
jgi:hypothetical protein